jgi:TolA-binding protein
MTTSRPLPPAGRPGREPADALLETCRPLPALPPAAHARVKRRLALGLAPRTGRRRRWLEPVILTSVLLACGAAFGIALDRIVLTRSSVATGDGTTAVARAGRRSGSGKNKATPLVAPSLVADTPFPAAGSPDVTTERLPAPPAPASPPATSSPPAASASRPAVPARAPAKRLARSSPEMSAGQAPPAPAAEPPPPVSLPEAAIPPPSAAPPALPPVPAGTSAPPPPAAPPQPSPASADGLSEERLLAAAVRALRSGNDARSALAALDEYRTRYPQGRLAVEASALRASALLALDRHEEALRTLDGLDLARVPGGLERQLQRGELRSSAGRHQEAIADFDVVLARLGQGALAERALWGRAQSRLAGGDRAGAQSDAAHYLRRFPRGRFAAGAARLAGGAP